MEFAATFMGRGGLDELKKHCKQGDDFCKEVLAIINERSACEMAYAKSLKRLSQRLSKACSGLMRSPLSTLWKTVFTEMDREADARKKFSLSLLDDCVKPSAPIIDNMSKSRKILELSVESASKIMSERLLEHSKLKKRHHQLSKEKESLCDQLEGARPKTKNDETKLAQKQSKTDVLLTRTDDEYYDALLELHRKQTDWELTSRSSCIKIRELEQNKMDRLCRIGMSYSALMSSVSQQLISSCEQIKNYSSDLDPDGEIRIVVQSRKKTNFVSELILCDYFCENFKNSVKPERRIAALTKPLEKFLGDLQKERAHHQGMVNLINAQSVRATEDEKLEMKRKLAGISSMLVFLEVSRSKLQKAISTINGKQVDLHPLTSSVQQHYDKQGIMHSTLMISTLDGVGDDEVFGSPTYVEHDPTYRSFAQRSQSEKVHAVDDIDIGRPGSKSRSLPKHGTLTAKQMQRLSYGMENGRKQAPAPPNQHRTGSRSSSVCKCVARYRYDSRHSDELTIQEGDVITVVEKCDSDWWKGELDGDVGIFPAIYVESI